MPAGTNENVKLVRVAYEPFKNDGTGDNVLKFEFKDEQNRSFTHNEWEIKPDRIKQNAQAWNTDYKDLLEKELASMSERIKHIMAAFMPYEDIKVAGSTWAEFARAIIDNLGTKFEDVPVRIKLILNKKDYCTFPKRAINDFIVKMSAPDTFSYNPKYDRIEPLGKTDSDLNDLLNGTPALEETTPTRLEDDDLAF
jgi:hypothetical protein